MNLTSVTVSADVARAASKSLNTQTSSISPVAQATNAQATNLLKQQPINAILPPEQNSSGIEESRKGDSVSVSSTIGRAASSGQLSREQALAIYQKIASLL